MSDAPTNGNIATNVAIQLKNVSVRYRVPHERYATIKETAIRALQRRMQYEDFWALRDINVEIHRGEVVGIIGRNGAGKSTLLKVIARVLHPKQGYVWVRGRVAPLLEFGAGFHPELTGRENVFLNGAILGFSHAQMDAKFKDIVDFAELGDFIDAPLRTYSSGMAARLGFSVATDVKPDVLIVDEVLAVGDTAFQKKSAERIRSFWSSGMTILYVSHNLDSVKEMCMRAIWLERGQVKADGPAEVIVEQYRHADRQNRSGASWLWGSHRIEIAHVHLLDARGEEQALFHTGEPFVLQFDYHTDEAIPSPVFGMALHRQDGMHITGPNTSTAGLKLPAIRGNGTVTYTVPYLPLLEGEYQVSISAHDEQDIEMYEYHDRAYVFRVVSPDGRAHERFGLVTLRGEWKCNPS